MHRWWLGLPPPPYCQYYTLYTHTTYTNCLRSSDFRFLHLVPVAASTTTVNLRLLDFMDRILILYFIFYCFAMLLCWIIHHHHQHHHHRLLFKLFPTSIENQAQRRQQHLLRHRPSVSAQLRQLCLHCQRRTRCPFAMHRQRKTGPFAGPRRKTPPPWHSHPHQPPPIQSPLLLRSRPRQRHSRLRMRCRVRSRA